jgi:hypothetical protein
MPLRSTGPIQLRLAAFLFVAGALAGCTQQQSTKQAEERQFQDNPQLQRVQVVKFGGRVTADGQPAQAGFTVFVILNDPGHLDQAAQSGTPKLYTPCDETGHFAFTTVTKGDGAPAGKYVLTFVELKNPEQPGQPDSNGRARRGKMRATGSRHYEPPDALKNLYNDPDKNSKDDKFVVKLEAPGKDDWDFNLDVSGKEAVPTPGPNAVTRI